MARRKNSTRLRSLTASRFARRRGSSPPRRSEGDPSEQSNGQRRVASSRRSATGASRRGATAVPRPLTWRTRAGGNAGMRTLGLGLWLVQVGLFCNDTSRPWGGLRPTAVRKAGYELVARLPAIAAIMSCIWQQMSYFSLASSTAQHQKSSAMIPTADACGGLGRTGWTAPREFQPQRRAQQSAVHLASQICNATASQLHLSVDWSSAARGGRRLRRRCPWVVGRVSKCPWSDVGVRFNRKWKSIDNCSVARMAELHTNRHVLRSLAGTACATIAGEDCLLRPGARRRQSANMRNMVRSDNVRSLLPESACGLCRNCTR